MERDQRARINMVESTCSILATFFVQARASSTTTARCDLGGDLKQRVWDRQDKRQRNWVVKFMVYIGVYNLWFIYDVVVGMTRLARYSSALGLLYGTASSSTNSLKVDSLTSSSSHRQVVSSAKK